MRSVFIFLFFCFFSLLSESSFAGKNSVKNQTDLAKKHVGQVLNGCITDFPATLKEVINGSSVAYLKKKSKKLNPFLMSEARRTPKINNSVRFGSGGEYFEDVCSATFNYCRGVSTLTRDFNLLAFYDKKNIYNAKLPKYGSKEWVAYYKKIISDLTDQKPVIVPGFRNLKEFSTDPHLTKAFKEAAVDIWAKKNMDIRSIKILKDLSHDFGKNRRALLLKKLETRLKLGYNPIVYLGKLPENEFNLVRLIKEPDSHDFWVHVMQVYKVVKNKKSYDLYLWNPTYISPEYREYVLRVPLNDKKLEFSAIDIVPGDDEDIIQIFDRLVDMCKKNPELCPKQ